MHMLTVLSLSTGDINLLTAGALKTLKEAKRLVLRTERHPVVRWLSENEIAYESLDALYEQAETFDAFNQSAAQYLAEAAEESDVVYGVTDAAMDATVTTLAEILRDGGALQTMPGISHANRCLAMAKADMLDIRLSSAEKFLAADDIDPSVSCFLAELHSKPCAGACKIKLMQLLDDQTPISFFWGDEEGRLHREDIPLFELDRQAQYDHLTACLYVAAPLTQRKRFGVNDLCSVMTRLRSKSGCPWDQEQTHESLLPNLLEESYEYIEAVREADAPHMCEELGDVLLQVIFHATIARQTGEFDLNDVATGITAKLIERHPHVFSTVKADTPEEVLANWEQIKRKQRGLNSVADAMDNVSAGLSALLRASKVQHKAAKVGFDFPDAKAALEKVTEESGEVLACLNGQEALEEELGDLLFSVVNVCRLCGVNPDIALYTAVNKFISRFRGMENTLKSEGKSMEHLTLKEMDVYWVKEKHISNQVPS